MQKRWKPAGRYDIILTREVCCNCGGLLLQTSKKDRGGDTAAGKKEQLRAAPKRAERCKHEIRNQRQCNLLYPPRGRGQNCALRPGQHPLPGLASGQSKGAELDYGAWVCGRKNLAGGGLRVPDHRGHAGDDPRRRENRIFPEREADSVREKRAHIWRRHPKLPQPGKRALDRAGNFCPCGGRTLLRPGT